MHANRLKRIFKQRVSAGIQGGLTLSLCRSTNHPYKPLRSWAGLPSAHPHKLHQASAAQQEPLIGERADHVRHEPGAQVVASNCALVRDHLLRPHV